MRTERLLLEPMFDGEAELSSIFDKMVRAKLIDYIEDVEVEIVWNFGEDVSRGLTVAVMPRCGSVEEISNKLPISLFPLSDLLDEWAEHIEDAAEDEETALKYLDWVARAVRDLDAVADKIRQARAACAEEEKEREAFRKLFDEKYPHLSYENYHQQRDKAEEELRTELASNADNSEQHANRPAPLPPQPHPPSE